MQQYVSSNKFQIPLDMDSITYIRSTCRLSRREQECRRSPVRLELLYHMRSIQPLKAQNPITGEESLLLMRDPGIYGNTPRNMSIESTNYNKFKGFFRILHSTRWKNAYQVSKVYQAQISLLCMYDHLKHWDQCIHGYWIELFWRTTCRISTIHMRTLIRILYMSTPR